MFCKVKVGFEFNPNRKGSGKLVTDKKACSWQDCCLVEKVCFEVPVAECEEVVVNQFTVAVWIDTAIVVQIVPGIVKIGKSAPVGDAGTGESGKHDPGSLPQPVQGKAQLQVVVKEAIADVAKSIIGIDPVVKCLVFSGQEPEFPVNTYESIFLFI